MFFLGLLVGLAIGAIFHVAITKWFNKAKDTATEITKDIKADAEKLTKKF